MRIDEDTTTQWGGNTLQKVLDPRKRLIFSTKNGTRAEHGHHGYLHDLARKGHLPGLPARDNGTSSWSDHEHVIRRRSRTRDQHVIRRRSRTRDPLGDFRSQYLHFGSGWSDVLYCIYVAEHAQCKSVNVKEHTQWKAVNATTGTTLTDQRDTWSRYNSWFVLVYWPDTPLCGPDVVCPVLFDEASMTFLLCVLLCVSRWVRVFPVDDVSPWKWSQYFVTWLDR